MISEIELLRKDIPRLEMKFGAGNLFVEVLKAQLVLLQNQTKQNQPKGRRYRQWFEKINRAIIRKKRSIILINRTDGTDRY